MDEDATITSDPCLRRDGYSKERWPSAEAAWFVVWLVLDGKHGLAEPGAQSYAYRCPKCKGYHLASCKNSKHRKKHRQGLAKLQSCLAAKKTSQRAGKKLSDEEGPLT